MPSKHAAVYVRVSTVGQNLEAQLPDLKNYAQTNGLALPFGDAWIKHVELWRGPGVTWYPDKFTGRTMLRPGIQALIADLEAGKLSLVVLWRLDRLGRTASGLTHFFDLCRKHGVNLVSVRDGFDLSTPAGRFLAQILASVAEYELELKRERVAGGIEFNHQRQIRAHELAEAGQSADTIAAVLRATLDEVHRMLAKPKGKLWYGGRTPGSGMAEECSTDRVDLLLRKGLSIDEVAAVTHASRRTVYRRLQERRRQIAQRAEKEVPIPVTAEG